MKRGFSLRKKDKSQFGLFLGDLSIFCTEQDIVDTFQEYGEIVDVRIQRNKDTSRALSYGFIDFSTEEAAKRAMEERNGFVIKGRPLRIRPAAKRSEPVKSEDPSLLPVATVCVRFISTSGSIVTEELLRQVFSPYGDIRDVTIRIITIDEQCVRCKGYGFVNYVMSEKVDGLAAAHRAAAALLNTTLDGVNYRCEVGHKHQQTSGDSSTVDGSSQAGETRVSDESSTADRSTRSDGSTNVSGERSSPTPSRSMPKQTTAPVLRAPPGLAPRGAASPTPPTVQWAPIHAAPAPPQMYPYPPAGAMQHGGHYQGGPPSQYYAMPPEYAPQLPQQQQYYAQQTPPGYYANYSTAPPAHYGGYPYQVQAPGPFYGAAPQQQQQQQQQQAQRSVYYAQHHDQSDRQVRQQWPRAGKGSAASPVSPRGRAAVPLKQAAAARVGTLSPAPTEAPVAPAEASPTQTRSRRLGILPHPAAGPNSSPPAPTSGVKTIAAPTTAEEGELEHEGRRSHRNISNRSDVSELTTGTVDDDDEVGEEDAAPACERSNAAANSAHLSSAIDAMHLANSVATAAVETSAAQSAHHECGEGKGVLLTIAEPSAVVTASRPGERRLTRGGSSRTQATENLCAQPLERQAVVAPAPAIAEGSSGDSSPDSVQATDLSVAPGEAAELEFEEGFSKAVAGRRAQRMDSDRSDQSDLTALSDYHMEAEVRSRSVTTSDAGGRSGVVTPQPAPDATPVDGEENTCTCS